MTRENKLALIIGFTLVLVVGVLVSDYLSSGERPALDEMPPAARVREAGAARGESEAIRSSVSAGPAAGESGGEIRLSPHTPRTEDEPSIDVLGLLGRREESRALEAPPLIIDQSAPAREEAEPETSDIPLPDREARPGVRPGRVVHTVVRNDSVYRLAERYLGDGNRWREIRDANPGLVGRNGEVRIGAELIIPGASGAGVARPTDPVRSARDEPRRPAASSVSEYVVKPGDTLSEIAQQHLGSGSRASVKRLLDANKGTLRDADEIRVGMKLKIPR